MKLRISILASGSGSNAENIIKCIRESRSLELGCIITDNSEAYVGVRAKKLKVPCYIIERGESSRELHEEKMLEKLENYNTDWVFLAGFMRVLGDRFLSAFWSKSREKRLVINIHPSLLPKYKGLRAYERSFDSLDKYAGVTLHYVDEGVDTGEIILQKEFERRIDEPFEKFKQRGFDLEYQCYKEFIKDLDETARS